MSGIGQDGYGPGSGSSADYGYGSAASGFGSASSGSVPYSSSPFTYGQADPFQSDPFAQPNTYGAPQTPDPYAGAYPAPATRSTPTNTLAILSLVFSLAGLVTSGVTCIVGVILGHIARSQIKQTGEQGAGLALGGLITGYGLIGLWVLGIVVYLLFLGLFFAAVI